MLNFLMISAVFAVILGRPRVTEDQHAAPHAAERPSAKQQWPIPPTHVVIDPPLPAPNSPQPEPKKAQNDTPPKALSRWTGLEGVIVYITAFYVFISWLTLHAIRRQADTMERQAADARNSAEEATAIARVAADAALLNAQAIINAERAWLIIEPVDKSIAEAGYKFHWRVRNVGRTPAKLIETNAMCEVAQLPISIIPIPRYEGTVVLSERLLAPGDSIEFEGYWEVKTDRGYSTYRGEFATLNGLELLAYGYAKYVTYNGIRESNFCSGLSGSLTGATFRPRLDAPPQYTRHT